MASYTPLSSSGAKAAVHVIRPGQGLKEDFNVFLHHFTEKNTLRYEDFAELWKELDMPYLFAGMADNAHAHKEAVEYAYMCAMDIFNSSVNLQAKTCAIYLLYAVYYTQGLAPRAQMRVTPAQFTAFVEFVKEMSDNKHYDFVYTFARLRMEKAFLFVATAVPQGRPKKKQTPTVKLKETLPTGLASTFSEISMEAVDDVAVINEEYNRVKCEVTNPGQSTPHPSLDLAKPDFIRDITRTLARFDNWRKTGKIKRVKPRRRSMGGTATTSESEGDNASDSDSAPEFKEESIASKRQRIRDKAYGTVSDTRRDSRYRKMVAESSQSDSALQSPPTKTRAKRTPKQRTSKQPAKNPTAEQLKEMEITNAYLQLATAPSKTVQRRRRMVAKQQAAQNAQASDEDSD